MSDLVKKIRTNSGDLQIDYNALANLPGDPKKMSGDVCTSSNYVSGDTHWQELGYIECIGDVYFNCVLLITSSYWGNSHGSGDIIYIQGHNKDEKQILTSISRTYLGGHDRLFKYRIDDAKHRIYFYVNTQHGGSWDGYGIWSITQLFTTDSATWVKTFERSIIMNGSEIEIAKV